jgi:hypothetical protein
MRLVRVCEREQLRLRVLQCRWRHLAQERIEGVEPKIPLGKRFWALTNEERAGIKSLFAEERARKMLTHLKGRDDKDPVKLVDALKCDGPGPRSTWAG